MGIRVILKFLVFLWYFFLKSDFECRNLFYQLLLQQKINDVVIFFCLSDTVSVFLVFKVHLTKFWNFNKVFSSLSGTAPERFRSGASPLL